MQEAGIATNMTSKKKYLWFIVLPVLAIIVFGIKEYNRKPKDLSEAKPQIKTTAVALINAFKNDEATANKLYLGKTIEVSGAIAEIENEADTLLNIYLGDDTLMEKVSCSMDMRNKEKFGTLTAGQQISIIGFCTGYLQDVEMNRCAITASQK